MPFRTSPRLRAFDYLGLHRYFLTLCVRGRARVFVGDDAVRPILRQLLHTAAAARFAVPAYCVMPDHLHALVEATTAVSDFRELVRIFKQRSAFDWKRSHGGDLWQRGYFERVLRSDEDTAAVARYLLANPVRAGLVRSPADYPFLGSATMDIAELLDSVREGTRRT